ncbi:helix-turn-helix domain-containing protein [uncultured Eubacterium sp.]|uniref:helix-turn-helix domain-containing protein n=1 Tax=uncultured Eubacterium sp. TaxID=165185 RepID=UPI0025E4944D|nr:helix-turn-helix transcriptional regulator [uncultured Eubacterium sp.]
MEVNYRLIGTRLCQRRKELHLTQKKLGDKMHISSSHISAIETGTKQPSLETLLEFCKTLNINIDYLLNGTLYNELDEQLVEKIKLCSFENRNRISKIVDVFLEEEKLEK